MCLEGLFKKFGTLQLKISEGPLIRSQSLSMGPLEGERSLLVGSECIFFEILAIGA